MSRMLNISGLETCGGGRSLVPYATSNHSDGGPMMVARLFQSCPNTHHVRTVIIILNFIGTTITFNLTMKYVC